MATNEQDGGAEPEGEPDEPAGGHGGVVRSLRRPRVAVPVLVVLVALAGTAAWRWRTDPDRRLGPDPTVEGIQCGLGQPPGSVLSLDGDTGALRWSRLVGDGESWPDGLAMADGTLAVFADGMPIQGLAALDGAHRWCGEGDVVSSVDDRLFTIHGDTFVELDAATGETEPIAPDVLPTLLEQAADPIAVRSEPVEYGRQGLTITATDRATGTDLWTREVPGYEMVTTDDLVLVNDQTNGTYTSISSSPGDPRPDLFSVTAYRLMTGDEAWSVRLPRFGGLYLAGDRAYVIGWDDHTVRAIDTATGQILWAKEHDHPARTGRYSEPGDLMAVAVDPETGDVFVLLLSIPPYRD